MGWEESEYGSEGCLWWWNVSYLACIHINILAVTLHYSSQDIIIGGNWVMEIWDVSIILEKAMATHSSTLAWKIPWTEEPRRLQSMGSLRVGHDWGTSLSIFTFMCWRRKWKPTPVLLPGESQGWGSLVGCRHGVAQSWLWLKRLSSSSSNIAILVFL